MNSWNDPRLLIPLAAAGGAIKGLVVGVAIGKVGSAVALGVCGGALVGALLAWRPRQSKAEEVFIQPDRMS